MIERQSTPLTVDQYLAIKGKIVSREEGEARKFIDENFIVQNNAFVSKKRFDEMLRSRQAPLGVVSKDPSEESDVYRDYFATNLGFIQETTRTLDAQGELSSTNFSDIQGYLMNSQDQFLWAVKSRQFGFSFVLAARALAKAMLKLKHTSIFVSYNEEESKEKIVYARELFDSMPLKWRLARKLKYDNKTNLVFEKAGNNSAETRILSYPQRILRGKGGEVDIGLDEFAHCIHAKKIYVSAMPAMSRGSNATIWIGSSPAGKGGLFYEVGTNHENEYAPFARLNIPWWIVPEFCTEVDSGRKDAWDMHTDERIERYATHRLKMIRKTMPIDDFRQEYECAYLDEMYSYFPMDLIHSCVPVFNVNAEGLPDYDAPAANLKDNDKASAGSGLIHFTDFEEFMHAIDMGIIKNPILGGFDVGRTTDASEVYYIEEDQKTYHQTCRCNITLKNVPLPEQRRIVVSQFERLAGRLIKFGVDYNGIGRNIAEDLEEQSFETVEKLDFNSNAWKEEACRRFKFRMSKQMLSLPNEKKVLGQIHSVKRMLLPGGTWRFDVEKNSKHHADKFWGLLAASEVGHPAIESMGNYTSFDERVVQAARSNIVKPHASVIMALTFQQKPSDKFNPWGNVMAPPMVVPTSGLMSIPGKTGGSLKSDLPFRR